jgi:hypothetical protein
MAGYAVSGFVDGLFKGIGVKHGWEDRKRNQKRENRMDEITSAREARAAEEHARRMRVYDRSDADWKRGREDDDFFRQTFEGAADATDQAMGGMGVPPPPQATQPEAGAQEVTTSTQTAPKPPPTGAAPAVAAALGIDPRALGRNHASEMMQRLSPAEELAARAAEQQVTPRRAGASPAGQRMMGFDPIEDPARQRQAQQSPYPMGSIRRDDGTMVIPNSRAIADELYQSGAVGPRFIEGAAPPPPERPRLQKRSPFEDGVSAQSIDEFFKPARDIVVESADKTLGAITGFPAAIYGAGQQVVGAGVSAAGFPETGDMLIRTGGQNRSQGRQAAQEGWSKAYLNNPSAAEKESVSSSESSRGMGAVRGTAAAPPPSIPMKAAATPTEKKAAATAVQTLDQTASPETKDATVAATQAMDVKPGQQTITDAQYQRGSQAWIDQYMKVGAPRVMEALISRGEFEKAEAFQQFMQTAETRAGMKDWSIAAAAATLGDIDKFGEHIISAYNRAGYFPDDTSLVKGESGFTKGRDGKVNGAKLVFKDEKTGNTFEQVFNGPDDLIRTGITLMAPENAFEFYWKQQQAAQEAAKGAMVKADEQATKDRDSVFKAAQDLMKEANGLTGPRGKDGNPAMTLEEAIAEVIRGRRTAQELLSGGGAPSAGGGASGQWGIPANGSDGQTANPRVDFPVAHRP